MAESFIGRKVRLTGEAWGTYGMPDRDSIHTITHDPGYALWAYDLPAINPGGDEWRVFYVAIDGVGSAPAEERRDWGVEWYTPDEEFGELLDTYHDAVVERTRVEEAAFDRAYEERVQDEEAAARRALIAWAKAR